VLSSTANGQLQSQHEYTQQQQYDNTGRKKQQNKDKKFWEELIAYFP
jgi:hypothetical protein